MKPQPTVNFVLTTTGWGGLEMNMLKLAEELREEFNILFTVKRDSRVHEELALAEFELIVIEKPKKYFDFASARKLGKIQKEKGVNLCFTAYRPDLDMLAWLKTFYQSKVNIVYQQQMQIGPTRKGLIHRFRYSTLCHWIAPLQWLRKETLEKTHVPDDKIRVIPLGVNTHNIQRGSKDVARQNLNLPQDSYILGVLGRIDPKKGQFFLVKILPELKKINPKTKILLFGSATIDDANGDKYFQGIKSWIAEKGLEDHVYIQPYSPHIHNFYNAIDVFVMASQSETYGMVTVEAMLYERPILGTDSGGTPELLGKGSRGNLFEYQNESSFISAFKRLNADQEVNSKLEEYRQFAEANYSLDKEVREIREVFLQCV